MMKSRTAMDPPDDVQPGRCALITGHVVLECPAIASRCGDGGLKRRVPMASAHEAAGWPPGQVSLAPSTRACLGPDLGENNPCRLMQGFREACSGEFLTPCRHVAKNAVSWKPIPA